MSKASMHDEQVLVDTRRKNTWKKTLHRQLPLIIVMIIIGVLCFWAGTAWGTETKKQVKSLTVKQVNLRVYREDFVSQTTTTTVPYIKPAENIRTSVQPYSAANILPPANNMSHNEMMAAAGVDEKDWPNMEEILRGENADWNPCMRYGRIIDCNYQGNAAYGVPQALPGSKMSGAGADWKTNPVTQLRWMDMYCNGDKFPQAKFRFHNWPEALAYKRAHGTY